ncbi:MAG: hypothetical protein ACOVOQ_04490 [Flavobacterium sp.]
MKKKIFISILLINMIFISCQSYFDYKPLVNLNGKEFRILDFSIQNRGTLVNENIDLGKESKFIFSDCNSKKDLPCTGTLILDKENLKFTFSNSYTVRGIFIQGIDTTMKIFPLDLPTIILTGDYKVEEQKKGEYLLIGTIGFKKNYPSIYATHEAKIKLKIE